MTTILVDPKFGFALDDEMYERAADALREFAPEWADRLTWKTFTARESWVLVPDAAHPDEDFYKAELTVLNEAPWSRMLRVNVWVAPDLRRDGAPMPHSHPWPFEAHVLMGGYQEDRYTLTNGRVDVVQGVVHQEGGVNILPLDLFHEVTDIFEPGRTVTLMDCGEGEKERWGYLDPDTGEYTPNRQSVIDPGFRELLLDRNPHLR